MTKQLPLTSVIIPVYNVEQYITSCLDSILNQSYNNLEIILVDDGSTDSSGKICDQYASKDLRIKVIHKKNGGVSSSRNIGLDYAKGEYIIFVDADDLLMKSAIEDLYNTCNKNDADLSMCNFSKIINNKCVTKLPKKKAILSNEEVIKEFLNEKNFNCAVWNKLFKKELLNNKNFNEKITISEDTDFLYRVLKEANKTAVDTSKMVYQYFVRYNSISERRFDSRWLKEIDICKNIIDDIKISYPYLKTYAIKRYQRAIISILSRVMRENGDIDGYDYLIDDIEKYPLYVKGYNRIKFFLIKNCKWLLVLIYKIYYKL